MFDHVTIRVADMAASRRFYDTVFAPLAIRPDHEADDLVEWADFSIVPVGDGGVVTTGLRATSAIAGSAWPTRRPAFHDLIGPFAGFTRRRATDDLARFKARAAPSPCCARRPEYHPGYEGACVLDPDADNVESTTIGELSMPAAGPSPRCSSVVPTTTGDEVLPSDPWGCSRSTRSAGRSPRRRAGRRGRSRPTSGRAGARGGWSGSARSTRSPPTRARGCGAPGARSRPSAPATPSSSPAAGGRSPRRWDFREVNRLIGQHNDWFPIERDLAMDPRTGDYVKIRGRSDCCEPLGPDWILSEFPPT